MSMRGVIFDFNGTLFFDSDLHLESMWRMYDRHELQRPTKEYMVNHIFGRTNRTIYLQDFNKDATDEEIKNFGKVKEELYRQLCLERPDIFRLVDGAGEMLDFLKENGIPYCIATGSPRDNMEFYFKHLGIDRWFSWDTVVYDDGTFRGKPAPDIYLRAADRLGLSPSECIVFEDGTSGILAANAAGIGGVVAVYEEKYMSPLTELTRVDKVFHDHTEWKKTLADYGILR